MGQKIQKSNFGTGFQFLIFVFSIPEPDHMRRCGFHFFQKVTACLKQSAGSIMQ